MERNVRCTGETEGRETTIERILKRVVYAPKTMGNGNTGFTQYLQAGSRKVKLGNYDFGPVVARTASSQQGRNGGKGP